MSQLIDSGIYEIINLTTNKVYIGHSKRMSQRWLDHQKDLNKNKHTNCHLQHAWNKYGKDDFIFRKIEFVENIKEKLIEREVHWCKIKDCHNPNKGYNIEVPGEYKKSKGKKGVNQRSSQSKYTLDYYLNHPKILAKDFTPEEKQLIAEKFVELRKEHTQVNMYVSRTLNNISAILGNDVRSKSVPVLIKETYTGSGNIRECTSFVQVDIQTGVILNRFTSKVEAAELLNVPKAKVEDQLEVNIGKAKSHQSRIFHPMSHQRDYILMYEKFYQPNYDYKSAIKTGELIKVVRGDYQDTLTKYEFDNLVGKEVNDYTWVRLRTISYEEGSVSHLGYTLTFIRKPLVDNPREPEMKVAEFKERLPEGKFSSKGTIIGLKDDQQVYRFDSPTDMATQLGFPYKQACRLLGRDNSVKGGKKKYKGVTFYYEKDLK